MVSFGAANCVGVFVVFLAVLFEWCFGRLWFGVLTFIVLVLVFLSIAFLCSCFCGNVLLMFLGGVI